LYNEVEAVWLTWLIAVLVVYTAAYIVAYYQNTKHMH